MGDIQHRRRPLRRWLCMCGQPWPCRRALHLRDEQHNTQDGEQRQPPWTARTAQGGVQ